MKHLKSKHFCSALFGTTLLFSLGCADTESPNEQTNGLEVKSSAVSECGGFAASSNALTDEAALEDYCAAEVLDWSYDKETGTLSLLNNRVILNCCGDHSFVTELADDGTYIVTELDEPVKSADGSLGRCGCECVFDFDISLENIPAEEIAFKLQRDQRSMEDINVSETFATVWEGSLNLAESSSHNTVVTNDVDADIWCSGGGE